MIATGAAFTRCTFVDVNLALAELSGANIEDCHFTNCKMDMTNWTGATMRQVRFEDCEVRHASFVGALLDRVVFDSCNLHYAAFFDANARAVGFPRSNLHGADLRFVELGEGNFEGAVLQNAQVRLGCTFWNGAFDERSTDLFLGMVARRITDPEKRRIVEEMIGGKAVAMTERMMAQDS